MFLFLFVFHGGFSLNWRRIQRNHCLCILRRLYGDVVYRGFIREMKELDERDSILVGMGLYALSGAVVGGILGFLLGLLF